MLSGQDGGPGALVKPSRDRSPAVAMHHNAVFPYDTAGHFGIGPTAANYEAVLRNFSFNKVSAADQQRVVDYQQHQQHADQQRFRDARDVDLSQHQQRSTALLANSTIDRPPFPSSPHRAAIYQPHVSSYASPRPPPIVIDASSTVKRPRLMSDFAPLHVEVEPKRSDSVAGGSAYKPQVEAISPTLPADDAHGNEIRHSIDELVSHIHRVDRDIQAITNNIEKLKKKQEQIEEEAKRPVEEKMATSEPDVDMRSQSISQTIYAENRRKVSIAHAALNKLGKATIMPLYAQPSDTAIFHENKAKFVTFKKTLVLYLKKQQHSIRMRERYLTDRYDKLLESWAKRLEKMEKKRNKDTKTREYFEKVFPEMKKQREEKERLQRVGGTRFSGYARSDANVEQIVENLHEQEEEERKMRNLAVIPPMLLDSRQRQRRYHNEAGLLEDPVQINLESMSRMLYWTPEDKEIFKEKYLQRPKNFGYIAAALENKTAPDCVLFYYTSKKSAMYKQMVRKHMQTSRKRKFRSNATAASAAAAAAASANQTRDAKEEKPEHSEQDVGAAAAAEFKKSDTDLMEKPAVSEEPEISRAADDNEHAPSTLTVSVVEPEGIGPTCSYGDSADVPHNGDMCTDGPPLLCPEDSGGTNDETTEKIVEMDDEPFHASEHRLQRSYTPQATGGIAMLAMDKTIDGAPVINGPSKDRLPPGLPVMSQTLKAIMNDDKNGMTAAKLIDAIITHETSGSARVSNRHRTGSRSSNCSDHTSDTMSADESQYEDDKLRDTRRQRQSDAGLMRASVPPAAPADAILAERRFNDPLSLLQHLPGDAMSRAAVLYYQQQMQNDMAPKLIVKDVSQGVKNFPMEIGNDQRHLLLSSGAVLLPTLELDRKASALSAKVQPSNMLRVRDVIHSAIEQNLQQGPLAGDTQLVRTDDMWKVFSQLQQQQSLSSIDMPMMRIGEQNVDSSQVQDLSCRRPENGQPGRDSYPFMAMRWPSPAARKMQSPPPAHSNYNRLPSAPQPPAQVDRQDALYRLAEVAVQRERAEVGHRGTSPQTGVQFVRDAEPGIPALHSGGSITQGKPHSAIYARRAEPTDSMKNNVVGLAENVLQYMSPNASHRAVMEHAMAALQPPVSTGNASRSLLFTDFLTAQQMNIGGQQRPRMMADNPVTVHPGGLIQQPLPPRGLSDVDTLRISQPQNGVISRPTGPSRSDFDRSSTNRAMPSDASAPASTTMPRATHMTAANVIEAIITQQINCEMPSSIATGSAINTELINRILDSPGLPVQYQQQQQRRVAVNGTATVANGVAVVSTAAGPVTAPSVVGRVNVNERIELERNAIAASRIRAQERATVSITGGPADHAVTLGEHIDAMIQKDFNAPASRFGDEGPQSMDSSRHAGSAINLRSFLEDSSDFNTHSHDSAAAAPNGCAAEASRGNAVAHSPATMAGQNPGSIQQATRQRDSLEQRGLESIVLPFVGGGARNRGRTPPTIGTGLTLVPASAAAAYVANMHGLIAAGKTSTSSQGFSFAPVMTSLAAAPMLNRSVVSPISQVSAASIVAALPPHLQDALAAQFKAAASYSIQLPTILTSTAGGATEPVTPSRMISAPTGPEDDSAPPMMNTSWKKKMSQELLSQQRLEQDRNAEQKILLGAQTSAVRSRPPSRSVTPAATGDPDKSRSSLEQAARGSQVELMTSQAQRVPSAPFSSNWLTTTGSRESVADPGRSPRSPRASSVNEKPISTIVMSHQTMSSLLQSKPVFASDKSPADGTSPGTGRASVGSDSTPLRPPSTLSEAARTSTPGASESPAKTSPTTEQAPTIVVDAAADRAAAPSPVPASHSSANDGIPSAGGDGQK